MTYVMLTALGVTTANYLLASYLKIPRYVYFSAIAVYMAALASLIYVASTL